MHFQCIVVQLKRGVEKVPHFAHYKKSTDVQCSQRFEGIYEGNWQSLNAEGKGQRQELFRLHFLKIIKRTFTDFNFTIGDISSEKYKIIQSICNNFRSIKTELSLSIKVPSNVGENNTKKNWNKELVLRSFVAREAIDYLSLKQSERILILIILYINIKFCGGKLPPKNNKLIFFKLKELLLEIDWKASFSGSNPMMIKNQGNDLKLKLNDEIKNTYYWTGYNYYIKDEFESAIQFLTKAIQIGDDYYAIHPYTMRAYCYESLGKYEEATDDLSNVIEFYCKISRKYSHSPFLEELLYFESLLIRSYLTRANIRLQFLQDSKNTLALNDFNIAIKIGKNTLKKIDLDQNSTKDTRDQVKILISDAYEGLAKFHLNELEDYEASIKYYSDAISFYPDDPMDYSEETSLINLIALYNNRGVAYFRNGNMLTSLQDHSKCISLSSGLDVENREVWGKHISGYYFNRFDVYYEMGDYERALEDLNFLINNKTTNIFIDHNNEPSTHKSLFEIRADLKIKMGLLDYVKDDLLNALNQFRASEDSHLLKHDCQRILQKISNLLDN